MKARLTRVRAHSIKHHWVVQDDATRVPSLPPARSMNAGKLPRGLTHLQTHTHTHTHTQREKERERELERFHEKHQFIHDLMEI